MSSTGFSYRADIDGLRAVAILLVVAFHVGLPGFDAGYVGVDVFFVISGYLIGGILWREVSTTGRIDFLRFYFRRVRRLLPALLIVLATTLVMATLILKPFGQLEFFSRSVIASALFLANFYFAKTTGGYFDAPSEAVPLLHLWSLAIEEQFYVVFPLALLLLWKLCANARNHLNALGWAIAIIALCSLIYSVAISMHSPEWAYFSPIARAWQLLVGVLAAIWIKTPGSQRLKSIYSILGIGLLTIGLIQIDEQTAYPGWHALFPTLACALIIIAGSQGSHVRAPRLNRLLGNRWLVEIGKVSYPWYLWHWPLLSLTRAQRLFDDNLWLDIIVALLSLILAFLTYRLIEFPLTRRLRQPGLAHGTVVLSGGALLFAVASFGMTLSFVAKHQPQWWTEFRYVQASKDRPPLRDVCHQHHPYNGLHPRKNCLLGSGENNRSPLLFVWGDSHADHWFSLADAYAKQADANSVHRIQRSLSQCPPLLGDGGNLTGSRRSGCEKFNGDVADEIMQLTQNYSTGVILGRYWIGDAISASDPATASAREKQLRTALPKTLDQLGEMGVRVLIMGPTPRLPYHGIECLARRSAAECAVSREEFGTTTERITSLLEEVAAKREWVRVFDATQFLCDEEYCYPKNDYGIVFWDAHHLTNSGARAVLDTAIDDLRWLHRHRKETGPSFIN